jgi:hypothetical protein
MEYLQEVRIKTNGIEAQYGGALGGVITAVTKSGGNEFHGEGHYYYYGNEISASPVKRLVLDPADDMTVSYFQDYTPKDNNNDVGGSLGGYLIKNKLYFYTAASPRWRPGSTAKGSSTVRKRVMAGPARRIAWSRVRIMSKLLSWLSARSDRGRALRPRGLGGLGKVRAPDYCI